MFKHCVAGIDFSAGWDQVHAHLKRMAALLGIRQLTLVHVDEPHVWGHRDAVDAVGSVRLEQAAADLKASLGLEVQARLAAGLAGQALLEVATDQHADLLVIANRSHLRGDDYLLGNAALSLARTTTVPLLVVPFEPQPVVGEAAPLLLISDNSADASKARSCFAALLGERKGQIMLLQGAERQIVLAEVEALDAFVAGHENVEFAALAGDPVDEICRVARELKVALIVVGKRSGAIGETYLEGLCRKAPSPVLVVPA